MDTNRIQYLLSKVHELLNDKSPKTAIEADLILDYLRVIYADMLEVKKGWNTKSNPTVSTAMPQVEINKVSNEAIEKEVENNTNNNDDEFIGINFEQPQTPKLKVIEDDEVLEEEVPNNVKEETSNKVVNPTTIAEEKVPMPESLGKKDIRKLIGLNDRYLFMNELFNNDKFDYEAVLDYINGLASYADAEEWIN